MTEEAMNSILETRDNQKIIRHSRKRKLTELVFLLMFLAVGTIAIVFGAVFNDQSLFFRITMIIFGSIVLLIYSESFVSIMMCTIALTPEGIRLRSYFRWDEFNWAEITSIELEKKNTRVTRGKKISKFTLMELITKNDESVLFALFRFRVQETEQIVELIKTSFSESQNKELNIIETESSKEEKEQSKSEKPLTIEEINSKIPPKVEDFEVDEE
ncbi:MAG: hypothetical protein KAJ76_04090 [Candidatus Heimdallarchaeota archaeon]|nr:hypothetical protein [Candidatus Heimdallarchaeota archaeon]